MLINKKINSTYPLLKGRVGGYWFDYGNGKISELFYNVKNYQYGFAQVQVFQNGDWYFLDENGVKSETGYLSIGYYDDHNGFSHVIVHNENAINGEVNLLRDCLGRHSINPTDSGCAIFAYKSGKLDWRKMRRRYFKDIRFKNAVMNEELKRFKAKNPSATEAEINELLSVLDMEINQAIADHEAEQALKSHKN